MSKLYQIIIGVLIGAMTFMFFSHSCQRKKLEKELAWNKAALDSCLNAPEETDTIYKTVRLMDTVRLKRTITETNIDTVYKVDTIRKREYKGTYVDNNIRIRWSAIVFGELESIQVLPTSSYRVSEIKTTRKVVLPSKDIKTPQSVSERFAELYLYTGAGWYDWNIKTIEVGGFVLFRGGFGIGAGAELNTSMKSIGLHTKLTYKLF